MSCKVEFTEDGKIRGVLNSENKPSTLFKQIVSNPILTLEQAIDAFKNTVKFQIVGEQGAQNLDVLDRRVNSRKLNYLNPIFTKRELEKGNLQGAKEAFENYTGVTLPMSATYQELEKIMETIDNGELLDNIPYNLIEEDYGATEQEVREVIKRYSDTLERMYSYSEATYRMDNLSTAREMEQSKKTPLEIRLATGWEKVSGVWKYEVGDLILTPKEVELDREYNISEVTDISELQKAYPEIKNLKIVFNRDGRNLYTGDGSTIELDTEGNTSPVLNRPKTEVLEGDNARLYRLQSLANRNLNHEIAHFIQQQEGFYRGGSPNGIGAKAIRLSGINEQDGQLEQRQKIQEALFDSKNDNDSKILKAALDYLDGNDNSLFYAYRNLAGEVEARNVEKRLGMTPKERATTLLQETEDVREEDKIFILQNLGDSASVQNTEGLLDQLKKTNLADNVYEMSSAEIEDKLVELGVDANVAKQVVAYHGSPYSFDRFTTNAMGTGEGAQAFGWGLYFTDLESIARNYAETLSNVTFEGKPYGNDNIGLANATILLVRDAGSVEKAIKSLSTLIAEKGGSERSLSLLEFLNTNYDKYNVKKNLYKVSLHKGKEVGDYTWLEWDKSVSIAQVTKIDELLTKMGSKAPVFGLRIPSKKQALGSEIYETIAKKFRQQGLTDKETSLLLLEAGIDGVKYPAESISRGATSDTARGFNYVVFDENAITIEEQIQFQKNGISLTTNGFVHGKDVYLNKESATDSTKVHEFNHLYSNYLKRNKKELYKRGIALIEKEIALGDKSEIKDIIDFVKTNQPNLKGEAFSEELLTEIIGRRGAQILESKSSLGQLLQEIWNEIKNLLGLSQYTVEQVMNMTLQEYADATAVDLIRGERLVEETVLYQTPQGEEFITYKEALKNTKDGTIKMQVGGKTIAEIDSSVDLRTSHGTINSLIKDNLLSGERTLEPNGDLVFTTEGQTENRKAVNAVFVEETAVKTFGQTRVKMLSNYNFTFDDLVNQRRIGDKIVSEKEVKEMSIEDVQKNFPQEEAEALTVEKIFLENYRAFGDKKVLEEAQEYTPENELQVSLMDLLNKLGVKITSITSYMEVFTAKNGVAPSAKALADIAEKVIAFEKGEITANELTEEVSHFIVEAFDINEVENLLRSIHKTPQYAQYAELYREIYSNDYKGEELENAVRREVLGKILAESLQANFEASQVKVDENFLNYLKRMVSEFFDKVGAYFRPEYQTQLENFQDKIFNNLLAGDLMDSLNPEQLEGNKFRLYNANAGSDPIALLAKRAEHASLLLSAQLYKIQPKDAVQKQVLEKLRNDIANKDFVASYAGIVAMVQRQTKYLQRSAERNRNANYVFSAEEKIVYNSLIGEMSKLLKEVKNSLVGSTSLGNESKRDLIISELEKVTQQIADLEGQVGNIESNALVNIVEKVKKRLGLSKERADTLLTDLQGVQKETNFLHTYFGQLIHAQNAYLNIAGEITAKTVTEARLGYLYNIKPFLNKLEELGIDPTTLKNFAKGSFIENVINRTALEEAQNKAETAIYNSLADTADQVTEEQYKERFNNGTLKPLDADKSVEYSNQIRAWKEANYAETMFTSEETKMRREKLQKYSSTTQAFEKIMSSSYADIMKNAEIVDGVPLMTTEMKDDIEEQRKSRTEAKSLFSSSGSLRKGLNSISLEEFDETNPNHVKVGNLQIAKDSTVESDGLLAFELNQIDNEKLEQFKLKGDERSVFSDSFKDMLSKMSDTEAYDFVALNSYIGYTSEYYEQTKSPETLIDRLRTAKEEKPDEADNIEAIIQEISLRSSQISNIISANKVMNNSSEVNFERMSKQKGGEVDSVLLHSEELQKAYTDAYKYLEKSERKEFENTTSITTPNKAFSNYIKDLNKAPSVNPSYLALEENEAEMMAVLEEVRKHVTTADRDKIDKAKYTRGQIARGVYNKISKNMSYIYKGDYSEMSEKEAKEMANKELLEYAYSKMMPYFKKTAPIGVDNLLDQFDAGTTSPREFIENYEKGEGDYKYLNISPNYNFQEVTNQNNLNQKFKLNKENDLPQIRVFNEDGTVNQFVDLEYVNKYGIDLKQLQATGVEVATKNTKEFQARQALLDLQRNTIETAGMKGSHDIYLLPQQEMTKARKLEEFSKNNRGKGVKRILEEFINFREDDAELGQTIDGKPVIKGFGAYTVPKYGFRKLTQSKPTDELLMSYAWMNQQAHLTKARMDNIGDMLALRDTLLGADFGNKETEATRTFQMFEENLKFNYFGIKENVSKEFQVLGMKGDWAKVARTFSNWIRLRNLGFNATIPITSALTASAQLRIETIVGERLDRGAKIKADREFTKLASSAMGEIMGFNSKADLNVLGEYFGQYNNAERLENSNYSKTLRGLTRAPYILHEAGNFPVIPRVILTILYDHKFVGDQLVDFRSFKQANKGRDSGELRREWDSFTTFYDVMKIKDGLVEFDEQKISDLTGLSEADTKEFLKDRLVGLTQKVGLAVQDIDQAISPEQKSIVARHALFSFFGIHRSWLFLAAQRKFKNRHNSLASGFTEEGSWMTPFRVINELASDYRDGKAKEFIKYVKERWENGSDTTKKNLIRGVTEMTILNLLVGMTFLALRELGDDDEDSYLFKLSSLFLMRTTNEVASATVALPKSIYDTLENTIVGLNSLQLVSDVLDVGSSDVVQRGIYAGKTERERYFLKHIPIWKEYNALGSGIDGTIKNYNYFNFVEDGGNTKYTINLFLEDEK